MMNYVTSTNSGYVKRNCLYNSTNSTGLQKPRAAMDANIFYALSHYDNNFSHYLEKTKLIFSSDNLSNIK